jgi:hypothetical protein
MNTLLTWIASIWPKIPHALRAMLLLFIAAAAIGMGGAVGYMAWQSGYIEQKLGHVATTTDLVDQTQVIRDQATEIANDAISRSFAQYDSSLKAFLRNERQLAVDTTLKPMLRLLLVLEARQKRMESGQKVSDARLQDLPRELDEKLRRIVEAQPVDRTAAILREIQDQLDKQAEKLEVIEKQRATNGIRF